MDYALVLHGFIVRHACTHLHFLSGWQQHMLTDVRKARIWVLDHTILFNSLLSRESQ
jgi:hypothetical protein